MRFTSSYIPTLKENPTDAEVISHKLFLRSGLIRRLTSGLYTYLPIGLKIINKISNIVREEMDKAGFQEILMPMVQPADLWKETKRWEHYGKELLRFVDRNNREYCLGPTHEEVVTSLVRGEVKSYRHLPVRLYQIQTKFRDEIRPRFGLMRGREFIMKDAYSFDQNVESAEISYNIMHDAYTKIFTRLGLKFRAVEADTGSIGGNFSHEFMVLADTGEDSIAFCNKCNYAANIERADTTWSKINCTKDCPDIEYVDTPNAHTVEEIAKFLNISEKNVIKTLLYTVDDKVIAVLARGDRIVNEVKIKQLLKAENVTLSDAKTVEEITNAPVGFAGPINLNIPIYADQELQENTDYVVGANKKDKHILHVNLNRDVKNIIYADLRTIIDQDTCPRCGGTISIAKGIEVGHIFMLGTKYSEAMQAKFLDEQGKEQTMIMGCYGIGISRIAAAAIEQNNDEHGNIFPPSIAPFSCILLNLDPKDKTVTEKCEQIYAELEKENIEVLLDDRDERPGIKFKDADLLGIPMQLVLGAKSMAKNIVECKDRRSGEKSTLELNNFIASYKKWAAKVQKNWDNSCKTF